MRKNAKKVVNFSLFLQFTDIYRNFWISKFFFVFTLNFCNTVNLRFLRIFFEFTVILFRTAINLRWPKVNFTTVNLPRKFQKKGVNRKTGWKVLCLPVNLLFEADRLVWTGESKCITLVYKLKPGPEIFNSRHDCKYVWY